MIRGTLTRSLFLRITPTILVSIIAIGGLAFHSATREINTMYDAQLIDNANVLWMLLQDEFEEAGATTPKQIEDIDFSMGDQIEVNDRAEDYADARMFRSWKSGKLALFSSNAFPETIPQAAIGFSNVVYNNELWRIYALPITNTSIVIEVGEKVFIRNTLVTHILLNLFFPLLALIPIICALIWFGIRSGLNTIHLLVQQISSRSADDLSAIPVEKQPLDLSPLSTSINSLLEKLDHSLSAERRFADHAAHQLRTPQATVKLLLQMLLRADTEEERQVIISDLVTTNEKATQLIEHLLNSSRVSHQPIKLQPIPLYQAVAGTIAEMSLLITQRQIDFTLEGDETALVMADKNLLHLLTINLIENAVKFTPMGGAVTVAVTPSGPMWLLSISDTGPGIPEAKRQAVFQRFYRVDTPSVEGTGLGLSIVSEIIARLHGRIQLKTPATGHGLLVEVSIPKG